MNKYTFGNICIPWRFSGHCVPARYTSEESVTRAPGICLSVGLLSTTKLPRQYFRCRASMYSGI